MFATLDLIKAQPELAKFQFRATNRWIDGAHNRSTIKGFYAAGGEDTTRAEEFELDAGEPAILLGTDTGPEPGRVPAARARRLPDDVDRLRGGGAQGRADLRRVDPHRRHGRARRARRGRRAAQRVRAHRACRSASPGDAPEEKLREVVERARKRSAVYDMVTNGVPVALNVTTDSSCDGSPMAIELDSPYRRRRPPRGDRRGARPASSPPTRPSTTATAATPSRRSTRSRLPATSRRPSQSSSAASASTPRTTSSSRRAASRAATPPSRSA